MTNFVLYNLYNDVFKKIIVNKLFFLPILFLLGCGDTEYIIGGERLNVTDVLTEAVNKHVKQNIKSKKIALSEPKLNKSWSHRNGNVAHSIHHPKLGRNFTLLWKTKIGVGNTRKTRITADPIVAHGMIFVLDSTSKISGVDSKGKVIWSLSLVPERESSKDASGGGLSFDKGSIYVVTGFGEVFRINSEDGNVIWKRKLDAPISAPPTVGHNLLYIITKDNGVWALNKKVGDIEWFRDGSPSKSVIIGGAAVALVDGLVIIPGGSGEVMAVLRDTGSKVWSNFVTGYRAGKGYANFSNITSDPVVKGNDVYVGNQSGALASIDIKSGLTNWISRNGSSSPVWVDNDSVFLISDQAELLRLDLKTGVTVWTKKLTYFVNSQKKNRSRVIVHYGPILAGGMLLVASENGVIHKYNPLNGNKIGVVNFKGGAASNLAVSNSTLYVVTKTGYLNAFK